MKTSEKRYLPLILSLLFLYPDTGVPSTAKSAQPQKLANAAVDLLLSRLDLDLPELEPVKKVQRDPNQAARALLRYYRQSRTVKHPVDRKDRAGQRDKAATERDMEIADNALQHRFIGQPAYPPHFCGEAIDWNSRPVPDNEWVWQLNRMYFWNAMARAYWHTGDEKYAAEWSRQLIDWTLKNPNDGAHGYAWRSIEAGIRGYSWTGLFQHFIDAPSFTPEVLVAFLNSCYDHATFLMTKYSSGSNWGLMEAEGLAFIAITFPEFKPAAEWRDEAFRRLNQEIDVQVYPDGHQRELAMGYHLGCIRWFIRTYELAKLNGLDRVFPDPYLKKIEKMCAVPMKLALPDGTNVQFGDAWAGTPGQHKENFSAWAELFNRDDFLFLATDGKQGTPPEATAFALTESGLYSMRSGWEEEAICLVLKCGPDGGGHCQPDNGTFDVYAGGRNFMPDAGSYIYHGDPEGRTWFRQTKVHQTLTLNGQNSSYAPRLLLWQPGEDLDVLVVENGSYPDLTHRRAVFFVDKQYFIIVDEAYGTGAGEVDIHFQLGPGEAIFDLDSLSATSNFPEGWNIFVQAVPQPALTMAAEEGQVSFIYTQKESRPAFRYNLRKDTGTPAVRFVTLVLPFEGIKPDLEIKLPETLPIPAPSLRLTVTEADRSVLIGYELD